MRTTKVIMSAIFGIFIIGAISLAWAETRTKLVKYRVIDSHKYQSFVKNWDSKKHQVLYALISSPDEWNAVFHPAPIMGVNRPFCPDKKLYDKEQILVVSRVVNPS
ncbi:hypothetical protein KAI19_04590, partial [bacterium]|nr:hypothetical protein [bacterium]